MLIKNETSDAENEEMNHSQEKVHRLIDMLTQEVSLVDRAANKRRFLVVKRSEDMHLNKDVKGEDKETSSLQKDGERPHSIPVSQDETSKEKEGQTEEIGKNVPQLISEAYKTLSVLCSKLEPGKELDEDSYQALDKLRALFGQQSKNKATEEESQEETNKQEMKCMYCKELAVKEFTCKDGKKLYSCAEHQKDAEKDGQEKYGGVVSSVDIKESKKTSKQDSCKFCSEDAVQIVVCKDGTEILCCKKHFLDAKKLAEEKHEGIKSIGGMDSSAAKSEEQEVHKAGAKLSKTRRAAMREAVETLISLLKDVMPEDELTKWPIASKLNKSASEVELEKKLSKNADENKALREELAKARHSVAMSNVNVVEEVQPRQTQNTGVEWPSDMNANQN